MSEADILELTYYDICDIYRRCKVLSEVGESIFQDDLVYENIKCGLSVSSVGSAGSSFSVIGSIQDKDKYTIVEEVGNWGKFKSGVGWVSLAYTKKYSYLHIKRPLEIIINQEIFFCNFFNFFQKTLDKTYYI